MHTGAIPHLSGYVSCAQVKEVLEKEVLGKFVQVRACAACHDAACDAAALHGMPPDVCACASAGTLCSLLRVVCCAVWPTI